MSEDSAERCLCQMQFIGEMTASDEERYTGYYSPTLKRVRNKYRDGSSDTETQKELQPQHNHNMASSQKKD